MELEFTVEFIVGFNGKVSDEGDIGVVVEGAVRNIKRTIGDFAASYGLERLKSFYISWFGRTP